MNIMFGRILEKYRGHKIYDPTGILLIILESVVHN